LPTESVLGDHCCVLRGQEIVIVKGKNPDGLDMNPAVLESDVRWLLAQRAARSSALYRATQLRDMLLFIVRETIANPDEPIHEFDLAHRVLGRRSDFNPLDDNIVRVQMAHLRKKLDLYFSTEGKDEDTVITVALGSYRPIFSSRVKTPAVARSSQVVELKPGETADRGEARLAEPHAQNAAGSQQETAAIAEERRNVPWGGIAAIALILALAAGCAALWVRDKREQQALDSIHRDLTPWRYQPSLDALWSGFFDSTRDTDVVVSDDSFLLIEELSRQQTSFYGYLTRSYMEQAAKPLSPELRGVQELLAAKSLGNTSEFKLAHRIFELDPLDTKIHLYSARQYMPALVKQNNVILIGGRISNPWSELFESRLNFTENTIFQGLGVTTVTNRNPAAGEPALYTSTDAVGYCVVAYLPNPGQDGKVLLLEGTSSEATEAAGDFLLSEDQFGAFKSKLHSTQLPYFEVLLKTSQVRGTPLTATVEAYRTYPDLPKRAQ
jgi:hypothetical protein